MAGDSSRLRNRRASGAADVPVAASGPGRLRGHLIWRVGSLARWRSLSGWSRTSCGSCSSGWCRRRRHDLKIAVGVGTVTVKSSLRSCSWPRRAVSARDNDPRQLPRSGAELPAIGTEAVGPDPTVVSPPRRFSRGTRRANARRSDLRGCPQCCKRAAFWPTHGPRSWPCAVRLRAPHN
jgi:hypothetical protein